VSILCTVLGFGLKAAPSDLLYLVQHPGLLLRSLLAVFVVMPILAVTFDKLIDIPYATEIVLVALAMSPVPPLLPQRGEKGGGLQSYGVALMAMLALLAILIVPLWAEILSAIFGWPIGVTPAAIARIVVIAALLPLIAGMTVHALWPAVADRLQRPVGLIAKVLLPLAVVVLLSGTWQVIWDSVGEGTVLALVAFVVVGLLVGHVLGGPDPEHSVVLALSTACRHPAIALLVASANFPNERFVGTILLYLILNAIVGLPYLAWQRRHRAIAAHA
jgi:BASS family bile acid:Na+ symporter